MPQAAPIPTYEDQRLEALKRYDLLDTESENEFDDITKLASSVFAAPIVLVSLIDSCRQWFKSRVGLDPQETHRNLAFCAYAILDENVFYVEDATQDERFADSPLVTGYPNIRTYAGAPLETFDGYRLGTLCLIYDDVTPLSPEQLGQLQQMAKIVMNQIESRLEHLAAVELQVKAERANENKSHYVAMISHELRNPMVGIANILELLEQEDLTKGQREYVDIVTQSSKSLLKLVDDILDFSKLEAGKFTLEKGPMVLQDSIGFVTDLLKTTALKKGINLRTGLAPDLPRCILGDEIRLRQILYNLIGNSLKFTEEGFVSLSVRKVLGEGAGLPKLCFSIRDTGIGISADDASKLFESYRQGAGILAQRYGGTGLGLSICKELVQLMGGEIGVTPHPSKGVEFWFYIPLEEAKETRPADQNEVSDVASIVKPDLRVLLAEDNQINSAVIVKILSNHGVDVATAFNGLEALEYLKKDTVDLVLMDIGMPQMDGISTTKAIRNGETLTKDVPIIAFTGNACKEEIARYQGAGMNAHVAKPVNTLQLIQTINSLVLSD